VFAVERAIATPSCWHPTVAVHVTEITLLASLVAEHVLSAHKEFPLSLDTLARRQLARRLQHTAQRLNHHRARELGQRLGIERCRHQDGTGRAPTRRRSLRPGRPRPDGYAPSGMSPVVNVTDVVAATAPSTDHTKGLWPYASSQGWWWSDISNERKPARSAACADSTKNRPECSSLDKGRPIAAIDILLP
jgi:hypothetical protein